VKTDSANYCRYLKIPKYFFSTYLSLKKNQPSDLG